MADAPTITPSTWIAAAPDQVFPYFTDPALIVRWLGDIADLDPRPGGGFAVAIGEAKVRGSYLAVEPPSRVVFTWGLAGNDTMPEGSTTVEILLAEDAGGTQVTLTHHDLPDEFRASHLDGWITRLGSLPAAVR